MVRDTGKGKYWLLVNTLLRFTGLNIIIDKL